MHAAAGAAPLAAIPDDERAALFESMTKTLRRSEYHWLRFLGFLSELPTRRAQMPGHVFWDEFVEFLYFEVQAFAGAARTVLDELVYIVARAHGVAPKEARRPPWDTSRLMTQALPIECQHSEVNLLRTMLPWFERLNAYRNSFFHHGWRHGAGHFERDDTRNASLNPAANALLVPDATSLIGRAKPDEWTYTQGNMVDRVMANLHEGLDGLLQRLCEGPWLTPVPAPGRLPRSEHPNMLVSLVIPAICVVQGEVALAAFFTTEDKGRALSALPFDGEVELVAVPVVASVNGPPAAIFSLKGVGEIGLPPAIKTIKLVVNPVVGDPDWRNIVCAHMVDFDLSEAVAKPANPISLVVPGAGRLFVWVTRVGRGWRA